MTKINPMMIGYYF